MTLFFVEFRTFAGDGLMARDMFYKRNLIIGGVVLLLLFSGALWLVGRKVDETARRIHGSMLDEAGNHRSVLVTRDFQHTAEVAERLAEHLRQHAPQEGEFLGWIHDWVRRDGKLTRGWYREGGRAFVGVDSAGRVAVDGDLEPVRDRLEAAEEGRVHTLLYGEGDRLFLTFYAREGDRMFGLDVSWADLHAYFAGMSPQISSYVYVFNPEGVLMVHPDEKLLGQRAGAEEKGAGKVYGRRWREAYSRYLSLPVVRMYYPAEVAGEEWTVVVNVVKLTTEEEMRKFYWYALFVVIFTVAVFGGLLVFSQYRGRREYDRRKRLEEEALRLNLRQLKNQVNPHFLFNALNSLSALIGSRPDLAKEFVLRLSKIYRYVLEKRQDHLVSVAEEVTLIRHYYFLQKVRFGESLRLEIAPGVEAEGRMIPLMSLQVLVENAVKHNEVSRQHPLDIAVRIEGGMLVVANTYRPRVDAADASLGVGLENIRKIYALCTDMQFTYDVEEGRFVCRLPLI